MSQRVQPEPEIPASPPKSRLRASSQNENNPLAESPRTTSRPGRLRSQTTGSASLTGFTPPEFITTIRESSVVEPRMTEVDTFGYFRRHDIHPKLHRKIFYTLNQRHLELNKNNIRANKVVQDAPSTFV